MLLHISTCFDAYCMVQINSCLKGHANNMGLTRHIYSFYSCATTHVHTRLMTLNLLFRALVYTLDMYMIVCRCMYACQKCICQIWIVCILKCMQIVKLYEHVHVLQCDSPHDTKQKPAKEFLAVKIKSIDLGICMSLTNYYQSQCDILKPNSLYYCI